MALQALWDVTQQFQNKNGSNLTSGKIYIYYQGRTALATTYHDEDGTVVNSNPVLLDNNGRATVFVNPIYSYTIVVCDYYGKELFSQDITLHDAISTAEDVVLVGTDGSVLVDRTQLPNGVQYDLSVNTDIIATKQSVDDVKDDLDDLTVIVNNHTTQIGQLQDDVEAVENALTNKKDKQTALAFNGSATKTVKKVTQNANGEITVEYEDIDLPPEVPNVEITSPNGTIDVQSSTDVQTNTKTFTIDVKKGDVDYYIGSKSVVEVGTTSYNITNNLDRTDGNIDITQPGKGLYLVCVNANVRPSTIVNEQHEIWLSVGPNNTYTMMHSLDWTNLQDTDISCASIVKINGNEPISIYMSYGSTPTVGVDLTICNVSVYRLDSVLGQGGGGGTYTAGDAIDITNSEISVKYGKGLTVNASNELEVKAGRGLSFDADTLEVKIDSEVTDVVQTVEKLKQDLDTQLTVNFDMPNVDNVYDFADTSVIGLSNGAVMLCQAFTVPINHDIRIDDGQTENPTLLGIYAKQAFAGKKIMLALYVYDFDTGYTDYVGDTGPVSVSQGRNEFPLKHINPNITELKSSCVYYASLYLPSNAHSNGLYLAGCPSYSNASYINATPRFTVGVENITYNNQEIDMTDATTGRLDYNDGNGNYYIGPWSDNYNERPAIPRFFMQIRNGEADTPIVVEPFTDIGTYTLKNTDSISSVFGSSVNVNTSTYGAVFMEVTPAQDVDVTGWVCYDNYATDDRQWYGVVFDSAFENQLSAQSNGTLSELGETSTGSGIYGHEFTRSNALHLTAGTTYRFLVGIPRTDNDLLVQYDTPTVSKNLHLFASGYNVSQWVSYSRANNVQGINFVIKDANNEWRI